MSLLDMDINYSDEKDGNRIYIKKGTDIPYFIKRAFKEFEIKFV